MEETLRTYSQIKLSYQTLVLRSKVGSIIPKDSVSCVSFTATATHTRSLNKDTRGHTSILHD